MHARTIALRLVPALALACNAGSGSEAADSEVGTTGANETTASTEATAAVDGPTSTTATPEPTSTGSAVTTDDGLDTGTTGEPGDPRPPVPEGMARWVTGDPEDADVDPLGPGLVLMGGGPDVDGAFAWWGDYTAGGDVVVIRTSGADGYNDYLFGFGNADSVETMLVTAEFADDPYVRWTLRHAEAIFIAGGNQATYLEGWMGTGVQAGIHEAWARGAVVGGTSAGLAVLGEFIYAAYNDSVYSYEALEDPYNFYMTMEQGFLALPLLDGVITDSHFGERDRMGRLLGFLARIHADGWATAAVGIGLDEHTAIVVGPDGAGTVLGSGHAYVVHAPSPPQTCLPGVPLAYDGLTYFALSAGDAVAFPGAQPQAAGQPIAAGGGVTVPADPYL
jgi:cyanophycinase